MAWNLRRQKMRYNDDNDDNPLRYTLVIDGETETPDSATITIYAPGNSTALLTTQAMTVSGNTVTYAPDTTTVASWPIDTGYRAELFVTYDSTVYERVILFDVTRFVLDFDISFDHLVALDDNIRGMQHDSDGDFSELILACRDIFQTKLEMRMVNDGKLNEGMILDASAVATAARFYILARIWLNKGDTERHDQYMEQFTGMWDAVLSSIRYDDDQSGEESGEAGVLHRSRLVM